MKILVVGSGAREHAIAWRLARNPDARIYALPGNPGIEAVATLIPAADLAPQTILAAAQSIGADLTVIGPEAPLVAGVVDQFHAANMKIVGPTAQSAQLEGSKIYAKNFFVRNQIPTARFTSSETTEEATAAVQSYGFPVVIKADGLAAGKGVVIAHTQAEAEHAIQTLGPNLVVEEFLTGPEVSFIVLSDGKNIMPFLPARDHKRIFDGDTGPNTGGMGAYCKHELLTTKETATVIERMILPTVAATQFTGFLYAGLIITPDGPKLLEYNVRMGDPETQPLMLQLESDLAETLFAAATGNLANRSFEWKPGSAAAVVLAAAGYPEAPRLGDPIQGIADAESFDSHVFQAGTKRTTDGLVTAGGRVLTVAATAPILEEAVRTAYRAASKIRFEGMQFRRDIGRKTRNQL